MQIAVLGYSDLYYSYRLYKKQTVCRHEANGKSSNKERIERTQGHKEGNLQLCSQDADNLSRLGVGAAADTVP